jgi:hypothetical protein
LHQRLNGLADTRSARPRTRRCWAFAHLGRVGLAAGIEPGVLAGGIDSRCRR